MLDLRPRPEGRNVERRRHRHHRRGRSASGALPSMFPRGHSDRDRDDVRQPRRRHVQTIQVEPVRQLRVAAVGDRARASARADRLMDGVKAALASCFVVALLPAGGADQGTARFEPSSVVLVVVLLFDRAPSRFDLRRTSRASAPSLLLNTRRFGTLGGHLAAADGRQASRSAATAETDPASVPARRSSRWPSSPSYTRSARLGLSSYSEQPGARGARRTHSCLSRPAASNPSLLTLPVYALIRGALPAARLGDRVREVRLLG